MKKCLFICLSVFLSVGLFAQEPDGLTCENAIPVDTSFTGSIPAPGVYYYSAWTYDLPLACYFYPEDENVSELYLDVDFTCTPGVYDDPKIEDLLNASIGWGVKMPIRFDDFEQGADEYGRTYYTLSVHEIYREMMANFGVSYNVQALIKVTTSSAGDIHMAPDTTFKACVENSIWLNLPDTAFTGVMTNDESYVLPLADWQNDSIQFRWTGKQAPVQVWIGDKCGFDLSLTGSNCAVDYFQLQPDAGNGENIYEMSRQMIWDMIDLLEKGGIYYVRIISPEEAELIVEKQVVEGAMANAIELELDKATAINANDTEQVYYFPTQWKGRNIEFVSSMATPITAYVSASLEFDANVSDVNVLETYPFEHSTSGAYLHMSEKELTNLCDNLDNEYLFVKFVSNRATTITPLRWNVGDCVKNALEIHTIDSLYLKARNASNIYRVDFAQWSKRDVTFSWKAKGNMKSYFAETCEFALQPTDEHVVLYHEFVVGSEGGDIFTITAEEMNKFADRVDEDGYLYVRFYANTPGSLLVSSVLSGNITPDPVYTTETVTVCYGESYEWNGTTYTETGKYIYTTVAANGADSIVTLDLTVLPEVPVTKEIAAVCYGETYTWQGQEYTESGEYSVTLQDVNGCDSVITLALTVYPQTPDTTEEVTIKFGESYEWNGETYSAAGEYTTILQDANGCNYQATLILTVSPEEKPEEDGTILLNPTDELVLNLDSAVNVYRTDYDVWSAAKVQLGWYGDKPLHVFASKDKDFFVAIYHEDVVLYQKIEAVDPTSVEPQVLVLDMSALRAYVNDGKLYVRFLTDSDARLVIEPLTE